MEALWYTPVCDELLAKIAIWHETYEKGDPAADKAYLETDGRVTNKTTLYAHKIKFTQLQISHLYKILKEVIPNRPCVEIIEQAYKAIKNRKGKLIPPNYYQVTLITYKSYIKEMFDALVLAKTGMHNINDLANNQEGKAPFEL